MSYTMVHRERAVVRNLNYSVRHQYGGRAAQPVGFRVWADPDTGRSILVINAPADYASTDGGFTRLMDLYFMDGHLRPWRVFLFRGIGRGTWPLLELSFSRDGDEYKMVDYAPVTRSVIQLLLGDRSMEPGKF